MTEERFNKLVEIDFPFTIDRQRHPIPGLRSNSLKNMKSPPGSPCDPDSQTAEKTVDTQRKAEHETDGENSSTGSGEVDSRSGKGTAESRKGYATRRRKSSIETRGSLKMASETKREPDDKDDDVDEDAAPSKRTTASRRKRKREEDEGHQEDNALGEGTPRNSPVS